VDWKFWSTLFINVVGVGFMAWQVRLMKQQIAAIPSSRSAKRIAMEKQLIKRLYVPVVIMAGLVILSWLPYVIAGASRPTALVIESWSTRAGNHPAAIMRVNASQYLKYRSEDYLLAVIKLDDPTMDDSTDRRIAKSGKFYISESAFDVAIPIPQDMAMRNANQLNFYVLLLPNQISPEDIQSLHDAEIRGGKMIDSKSMGFIPLPSSTPQGSTN
jgi:hypothetical protein